MKFVLSFSLIFVLCCPLGAQTSGIKGRVFDANGAIVLDVDVVAKSKKGALVKAKTNEEGVFRLDLSPGEYNVEIKHPFFCSVVFVNYPVVESMSFDIVLTGVRSTHSRKTCRSKTVKY